MSTAGLPVPVRSLGLFNGLGLRVHVLVERGRNLEALRLADELEPVARLLGDDMSTASIMQSRMYALIGLERHAEALVAGDALVALHRAAGTRLNEAKALADTAEVLVRTGRMNDGLYRLAAATVLLDASPRGHVRYGSVLSSVCGAARGAQLYELADGTALLALHASPGSAVSLGLQRAEVALDWALGLEQLGQAENAERIYARGVGLVRRWLVDTGQDVGEAPLAAALLAVGLAKLGHDAEAEALATSLIPLMRATGHDQEARKAHLAYGVVLRARGDHAAAKREFTAAAELAEDAWQRLVFRYELALLAAAELGADAAAAVRAALRDQAEHMWRLRLERRAMMQQARRRVELEVAQAAADRIASQDALTGLGNRRLFDRRIAEVDDAYSLVLVDVDNFKTINDTYSHQTGDRILCEVAAVLLAHCRGGDTAVRLGGDEFALFLRTDADGATRVAERVRRVLAHRDWSGFGDGLAVTLSIGVARAAPGMDPATLYARADLQLYRSKRAGRNRVSV